MKKNLHLKLIGEKDLEILWQLAYGGDLEWMKWNGPYFQDPVYEKEAFLTNFGKRYVNDPRFKFIEIDHQKVGMVSWYWEDGELQKWLEFGICIYDNAYWSKGVGTMACKLWISEIFHANPEIARVGFTTWSGNHGMIHLGQKLGMQEEARVRKVRFYQNVFYDSVKYGVLREEWMHD